MRRHFHVTFDAHDPRRCRPSCVDRQLEEEALTHGADPLHLALVFGIDEKTATRYAESARVLVGEAAEQPAQ